MTAYEVLGSTLVVFSAGPETKAEKLFLYGVMQFSPHSDYPRLLNVSKDSGSYDSTLLMGITGEELRFIFRNSKNILNFNAVNVPLSALEVTAEERVSLADIKKKAEGVSYSTWDACGLALDIRTLKTYQKNQLAKSLTERLGENDSCVVLVLQQLFPAGSGYLKDRAADPDPVVRKTIAGIFSRVGQYTDPDSVAILTSFLNDEDPAVKQQALDGLLRLGGDPAEAALQVLIGNLAVPGEKQNNAVMNILRLGGRAVPTLIGALQNRNNGAMDGIVSCLAQIGKAGLPALLTALKSERSPAVQENLLSVIGTMTGELSGETSRLFIDLLGLDAPGVSLKAARILTDMGDRSTPELMASLERSAPDLCGRIMTVMTAKLPWEVVAAMRSGFAADGKCGEEQAEPAAINYARGVPILEKLVIPYKGPEGKGEGGYTTNLEFVDIGGIVGGRYKGGRLLQGYFLDDGPCKGSGCYKPSIVRFALIKRQLVFLSRLSQPGIAWDMAIRDIFSEALLSKLGLSLSFDQNFTVPVLEYPAKLTGNVTGQVLVYSGEESGGMDSSKLVGAFLNPIFGEIYTTRPGAYPVKSFYFSVSTYSVAPPDIEECSGNNCFHTNAFFAFRPDGTFLKYSYEPDWKISDIKWGTRVFQDSYHSRTYAGCGGDPVDYNSVVSDKMATKDDLAVIGEIPGKGPVYGLKNNNNIVISEFYENYSKNFSAWADRQGDKPKKEPDSFKNFLANTPVFLWRDPFGRLLRFINQDYVMPFFCEPVIYLYPQTEQAVSVKLKPEVQISASRPSYGAKWEVVAGPSGLLKNNSDKKTYPYLFWEGASYNFPMRKEGFVITQEKVGEFLRATLPKLGLVESEAKDFLEAWLPVFSGAPYYFVTFVDGETIDKLAPLEVYPMPDTIIRVLMDFRPLMKYAEVPELKLSSPPKRTGFTVVEWGGIRR
jgi:HEAT repeat protein